jgi:hypothetical protein
MTLFWIFISIAAVVMALTTLVDIARRHLGGWSTAAWVVAVVILPFVGAIAYWIARPTSRDEVEAAYRAQTDLQKTSHAPSFDVTARERDHF